jgi:hypothetical protein
MQRMAPIEISNDASRNGREQVHDTLDNYVFYVAMAIKKFSPYSGAD